jgi:hypothetical protein
VRAPDYSQALIGWRVWLVVESGGELGLASVLHDELWPAARETVARCRRGEDLLWPAPDPPLPPHAAPHIRCTCGIHAARAPDDALTYLRGRDDPGTVARVLGTVALWGSVVELERGWRASHAYPLTLLVREAQIRRRLARYRVTFAQPAAAFVV